MGLPKKKGILTHDPHGLLLCIGSTRQYISLRYVARSLSRSLRLKESADRGPCFYPPSLYPHFPLRAPFNFPYNALARAL